MNINKLLGQSPGFSVRHGSIAACLVLSTLALPAIAAPDTGNKSAAHAPKKGYTILHSFSIADGALPSDTVVKGKNGYLYGTALSGGGHSSGVVYEIAPDGTESTLYNFAGGNDGAYPASLPRLFVDTNGNLYGTTENGGGSGCSSGSGCGTVFELTAGGTETVLHSFNVATDGGVPYGGVITDRKGNRYGTAQYGGSNSCSGTGCGTVYELAANGTFTVLHTFDGNDGNGPTGGLLRDKAGNLYGTTIKGGASSDGVVFKIAPDGTYNVLHSFTGGSDGEFPETTLVADASGNFYGTTSGGGPYGSGTVFKIAPNGTETILYAFTGSSDGSLPNGPAIDDAGNLYGTTERGGTNNLGTVFELAADGTESILHSFAGGSSDGSVPHAGVTINKTGTRMFGTTASGGGTGCGGGGCGTVFELKR